MRAKVLYICVDTFAKLLRDLAAGRLISLGGWPEDGEITAMSESAGFHRNAIAIRVESKTFDIVPHGEHPPELFVSIHSDPCVPMPADSTGPSVIIKTPGRVTPESAASLRAAWASVPKNEPLVIQEGVEMYYKVDDRWVRLGEGDRA